MTPSLEPAALRETLRKFLQEDVGRGDITTLATVSPDQKAVGHFVAKAPLVLAGIGIAVEVFRLVDERADAEIVHRDGEHLSQGELAARVRGPARALLSGERVATNLLQRLSGVATLTKQFVAAVEGTRVRILDTRKTTPGLRAFEKYAVTVGGGLNHRLDLGDAILIKENHIRMAGSVNRVMTAARSARSQARQLEIEVTNLEELRHVLKFAPDAVLLDNMDPDGVRQAVGIVRAHDPEGKILLEASGGITLGNVREFAEAGVDWISIGALTHSAPAVDMSFEIEPA